MKPNRRMAREKGQWGAAVPRGAEVSPRAERVTAGAPAPGDLTKAAVPGPPQPLRHRPGRGAGSGFNEHNFLGSICAVFQMTFLFMRKVTDSVALRLHF